MAVQPTRFGLIRHGETQWNRQKKIQGQTDTRLSREGRTQVQLWAERLKEIGWDRILTSDLRRARQTAEIINSELRQPVRMDSRLREQDWGSWTGLTVRQLRAAYPAAVAAQEAAGWNFQPPGGESRREVLQRSRLGLLEAADRCPGRRILVVTHAGVIKCLIYDLAQREFSPREPPLIRPYHLHWLKTTASGSFKLEQINCLALETAPNL